MMKQKMHGKGFIVPLLIALLIAIFGVGSVYNPAVFADSGSPSVLVLSADKSRLWNNETATFTLNGANGQVEWYVNDVLQDDETGSTFELVNPDKGEYRVYAKCGGGTSNVCSVTSLVSYGDLMNKLHYIEGKTLYDDMNGYDAGPYTGIGNAEHFAIVKDGDNGYFKSLVTQWGGSPWLATQVSEFDLVDNYEVSVDVMYPDGVSGISGFQIGGAVNNAAYEIGCIHFIPNGNSIVYVNGNGGQIVNSANPNLGGVYNTLEIKQGEWFRFRMIKLDSEFYYFVDDTLLVQQTIDFNYTKLLGIAFVQFLDNGVGLCYDNLFVGGLELGEEQDIAITDIKLNVPSTEGTVGNVFTAMVNWAPYNAKLSAIEWYVNDKLVEGQNGAIFNYLCDAVGQIKIQAKCGDISSAAKIITVGELRPFELKDTSEWEVLREENFDYWPAGAAWGANNPDVLKADGNGAVEHQAGLPYAKCGMFWDIGTGEFPINYELSLDFNFKENSVGYVKYFINGFFEDAPDNSVVLTVAKEADKTYISLLDESTGMDLMRSDVQYLGGYNIDLTEKIGYGEWHTVKMLKYGDGAALFLDDVMVAASQFNRSTAAIAKFCIVITQFFDQPEAGCYIDNAKILVESIGGRDVQTVTVSSNKSEITAGESTVLTAMYFPDTAEYSSVSWYVNGQLANGVSGLEYTFGSNTAGVYKIKCVIDGVESLEKTITVKPAAVEDTDDGGCNSSVNVGNAIVGGFTVVLIAACFVATKLIKRNNK